MWRRAEFDARMLAAVTGLLFLAPQVDAPTELVRPVAAIARSVAHYEALGFRVAERSAERVTFAARGDTVLVLTEHPEAVASPPTDAPVCVVPIRSLARERARLAAAAIEFEPRIAQPSGAVSLLVRDPDGFATILRTPRDIAAVALPGADEFGPLVVELLARYATDGTHRYFWPKTGGWKGNTKDLVYDGTVFAAGDPERRCYCCGLTFEVFFDAWQLWCARNGRPARIGALDVAGVRRLQSQWFGSAADPSCIDTALRENGLGFRITDWDAARPGDFVQLWRANGSGHSVVFLAWVRDGDGPDAPITGIRYWSTQGATNGIGERVESFLDTAGERRVLRDKFWLCRVGVAER